MFVHLTAIHVLYHINDSLKYEKEYNIQIYERYFKISAQFPLPLPDGRVAPTEQVLSMNKYLIFYYDDNIYYQKHLAYKTNNALLDYYNNDVIVPITR